MDPLDITQQYMDRGEAWHVGICPGSSQYIFTTQRDADEMLAHLNSIPGCRGTYQIRTQAEINQYKEAVRAAKEESNA